jgi:hypothetical protein
MSEPTQQPMGSDRSKRLMELETLIATHTSIQRVFVIAEVRDPGAVETTGTTQPTTPSVTCVGKTVGNWIVDSSGNPEFTRLSGEMPDIDGSFHEAIATFLHWPLIATKASAISRIPPNHLVVTDISAPQLLPTRLKIVLPPETFSAAKFRIRAAESREPIKIGGSQTSHRHTPGPPKDFFAAREIRQTFC